MLIQFIKEKTDKNKENIRKKLIKLFMMRKKRIT